MPELPEVETVVRQLRPLIEGKTARSLNIYDNKLATSKKKLIKNIQVSNVVRKGKKIVLTSDKKSIFIAVHLRMTGRLLWFTKDRIRKSRDKHLRAKIVFKEGELRFYDTRRFGTLEVLTSEEELDQSGIDPFSKQFTLKNLTSMLKNSSQEIKHWLMRQDKIVGLGNIYASEILYRAKIAPRRKSGSLTSDEIKKLHSATRSVLSKAIKNCGTTFSDFQQANGLTGSYQNLLAVYKREGESCKKCGSVIERIVQQQRSTFYCGKCQR